MTIYETNLVEMAAEDVDAFPGIDELILSLSAPAPEFAQPIKRSDEPTVNDSVEDAAEETMYTDLTDTTDSAVGEDASTDVAVGDTESASENMSAFAVAPDFKCDTRTEIFVKPGYLRDAIYAAEGCLAKSGQHFQRGGSIVMVYIDPVTGAASVKDMNPLALVHSLAGISNWMRWERRSETWVQVDPDDRICKVLLNLPQYDQLPAMNGLARQPFLRPDDSLCMKDGYDSATGQFGVFTGQHFSVPDMPTREQALDALALLDGLLSEFCFASRDDHSAALCAMLTAVVRPSLARAPMIHVRAPQIASGKSYLCELLSALASPQHGTPVGFPDRDAECMKLLLAQLILSPAVIEFDNLTTDILAHKSLCTAITSERIQGRILGQTKVVDVSTRVLFLSSGNNVGPVADMGRRCLTINLDPRCEVPAARTFKRPDLIADVRRERAQYVSAALTIVRAWVVAGRPTSPCRPLSNFNEWSSICRQPLMWLGQPDPATAVFVSMAEDPERQLIGRLLHGWHEMFGCDALMCRDVVKRLEITRPDNEDFIEALREVVGERGSINSRKLGHWCGRHVGRVVDGLRLVRAPKTRNVEKWRVESVKSVSDTATELVSLAHE